MPPRCSRRPTSPCQHTSAYVSIRQHTSEYLRGCHRGAVGDQLLLAAPRSRCRALLARIWGYVPGCNSSRASHLRIRQHTSAYISIRQHTSAYVSIRQHTSAYVSTRQHTSAYVSIRQHTSAYIHGSNSSRASRTLLFRLFIR
jgi:hypothetical protein